MIADWFPAAKPMTAGQTHELPVVATLPAGADANVVDDEGEPIAVSSNG